MGVRLHFIVEGQTEETFINRVLIPHLASRSIWGKVRCVMTGRKRSITHRGGLATYALARKDIILWMKEDQNPDAFFTTMFDLYALPADFPGYDDARAIGDPRKRVAALENAVLEDIRHYRFIPHIQLYEFETLIFADPKKLEWNFLEHDGAIRSLMDIASGFASPELIDDGNETAPSKRIIRAIPEYADMKVSAGPLVLEKIGLAALREKCVHFSDWLTKLERLAL